MVRAERSFCCWAIDCSNCSRLGNARNWPSNSAAASSWPASNRRRANAKRASRRATRSVRSSVRASRPLGLDLQRGRLVGRRLIGRVGRLFVGPAVGGGRMRALAGPRARASGSTSLDFGRRHDSGSRLDAGSNLRLVDLLLAAFRTTPASGATSEVAPSRPAVRTTTWKRSPGRTAAATFSAMGSRPAALGQRRPARPAHFPRSPAAEGPQQGPHGGWDQLHALRRRQQHGRIPQPGADVIIAGGHLVIGAGRVTASSRTLSIWGPGLGRVEAATPAGSRSMASARWGGRRHAQLPLAAQQGVALGRHGLEQILVGRSPRLAVPATPSNTCTR